MSHNKNASHFWPEDVIQQTWFKCRWLFHIIIIDSSGSPVTWKVKQRVTKITNSKLQTAIDLTTALGYSTDMKSSSLTDTQIVEYPTDTKYSWFVAACEYSF